ncbi:hypothetical protein ACLOJK_031110 [Asimina triloba]
MRSTPRRRQNSHGASGLKSLFPASMASSSPSPSPSPSITQPATEAPKPSNAEAAAADEEEEREDEEDDEDFNPLSHHNALSPEASSSLSSENEHSPNPKPQQQQPQPQPQPPQQPSLPIPNHQDQLTTIAAPNEGDDEEEAEIVIVQTREAALGHAAESPIDLLDQEIDAEDAICRRTRARYSLANFTLDELETFLQETDDEDDFHNANEEQEYRKFLAAVLNSDGDAAGDGDGNAVAAAAAAAAAAGDDDEENDADFEVEIEEALESDEDVGGGGRQPETRQKWREKVSSRSKKKKKNRKLLGQGNAPLRPLLPSVSNVQIAPLMLPPLRPLSAVESRPQPFTQPDQMMGFTPHQIGQLHCLIHEHVQLLIQVYSLSVLDPSKQQVANDVERLLSEISGRRDEAVARGSIPYPSFCFRPPYLWPSVSNQETDQSTHSLAAQLESSGDMLCAKDDVGPIQNSIWTPVINGPVRSVLDVAPLSLVKEYVADVSMAVQAQKQRHVEASYTSSHSKKEPLFPLAASSSSAEATNKEVSKEAAPADKTHEPKKSLAAMLVESTKNTVALVPKDVVKLAQRFLPKFNSALYPHKPPPAAIANRVLFTDSEDELLALGLMEYNNDWKAIQQRFLPCKSKHQIFVRQKNRSSSKAPENAIKAVRRMKTSPLTAEEKARIHEGLKVLKLNWISVWRFCVPHRDPALLPRQWRIALGTQKSYKSSEEAKEKRRLYEKRRRNAKKSFTSWQSVSDKEADNDDGGDNSADGNMDNEDEAYVHEAFLAGWKPGGSGSLSSELPSVVLGTSGTYQQSSSALPQFSTHDHETWASVMHESDGSQSVCNHSTSQSRGEQNLSHFAHVGHSAPSTGASRQMISDWKMKPFRPYRMRKSSATQLVKLAPDLPPVNLPPTVRVISQSTFKSFHSESPISRNHGGEIENSVMRPPHAVKPITPISADKNREMPSQKDSNTQQGSGAPNENVTVEVGTESDLQMHPLLFQPPEDGRLPYFPRADDNRGFSFFPGNPFHTNLSPFSKPQTSGSSFGCFHPALKSKETPSELSTIDFHPLLQRADNVDIDPVIGSSMEHASRVPELLQGSSAEIPNAPSLIPSTQQLPVSPYETTNGLDLDIHLSTSNSMDKFEGRGRTDHINVEERPQNSIQTCSNRENCPLTSYAANTHVNLVDSHGKMALQRRESGDTYIVPHEMRLLSQVVGRYSEDNPDEQSLAEIVMEQEELSDSEEEMGEDVEFECEEMADSEGEGLDLEQPPDIQDKASENSLEEEIIVNLDLDRSKTHHGQTDLHVTRGNSQKLELIGRSKNDMKFSSDLFAPGGSGSKQKHERRIHDAQDLSPGKSSKRKPRLEGAIQQSEASQQPGSAIALGNVLTSVKKPRKQACKMDPNGTSEQNASCSESSPLPVTKGAGTGSW